MQQQDRILASNAAPSPAKVRFVMSPLSTCASFLVCLTGVLAIEKQGHSLVLGRGAFCEGSIKHRVMGSTCVLGGILFIGATVYI